MDLTPSLTVNDEIASFEIAKSLHISVTTNSFPLNWTLEGITNSPVKASEIEEAFTVRSVNDVIS